MPKPLVAVVLALALSGSAGCQGTSSARTDADRVPPGCGFVDRRPLAGLVGPDATSAVRGSLHRLRVEGRPAECTTTATGHPGRFVRVRAVRHPEPMSLPRRACNAGWVYAGTPARSAPACQEAHGKGGTTVLFARWGEYVVRVTVVRPDRSWAGDPEAALELTRQLAARLRDA